MAIKNRSECCRQPRAASGLFGGPGFSRRQFFKLAGTGVSGYYLARVTRPVELMAADEVTTQNTARNCIFVFLLGAASHVDTFDLKEGPWTPSDFAPTSYGEVRFPQGLMPNLANQLDRLTIVRSVQAWAAVHGLAQSWTQIARNPTSGLGKIAPNVGAVVALEKDNPEGKLPGFVALNANRVVGPGYLDSKFSPFTLNPNPEGLTQSTHPDGQERFDTRIQRLNMMDGDLRIDSPLGKSAESMGSFYESAQNLMYDDEVDGVFKFEAEESDRYGSSSFGDSCIVARNIVDSNLGTRFVQINLGGWDHHSAIYDPNTGIYPRARDLDSGLSSLLEDLSSLPGVEEGKSLLDETMIVTLGEFGRTVAELNSQAGRDHYLQQFAVFAGGGAAGGRVIGATNDTGAYTTDPGWAQNRPVRPEDISATVYSALGIDWTTVRYDDPLGRGFEYIPFAAEDDAYGPVNEVFA